MIIPWIMAAAMFPQAGDEKIRIDVRCLVAGNLLRSTVTHGVLAKTPRWKEAADHPPLSARKAVELAAVTKERIASKVPDVRWTLESAAIVWVDKEQCYWRVQYDGYSNLGAMASPFRLSIVVLMNGFAVEPSVGKDAPGN